MKSALLFVLIALIAPGLAIAQDAGQTGFIISLKNGSSNKAEGWKRAEM